MSYYFRAENMSVGYRKNPVAQNVEFELEKGEILTLIGPNGAGKSTILKSIARQLERFGGTVYLDEKNMDTISDAQLSQNMAVLMTQRLHAEKMTCAAAKALASKVIASKGFEPVTQETFEAAKKEIYAKQCKKTIDMRVCR